jgi:hypothetical protein
VVEPLNYVDASIQTYAGYQSVAPLVDVALIERLTGQRRILTVGAAEVEVAQALAALQAAEQTRKGLVAVATVEEGRRGRARWLFRFFALPGNLGMEPWVFALLLGAATGLLLAIGLILLSFPILLVLAGGVLPFAFFLPAAYAMQGPPLQKLRAYLDGVTEDARIAVKHIADLDGKISVLRDQHARAVRMHGALVAAWRDPLVRLTTADPRLMSGSQFEIFLADIFRYRGYTVEGTGGSGDQGVDLVLTAPGGVRIAVQAKCYAESVGNSAVQQAYTGMAIYRCQRCAVVTSGTFTRGATDAAAAVRCQLIDRTQIQELIHGRIGV